MTLMSYKTLKMSYIYLCGTKKMRTVVNKSKIYYLLIKYMVSIQHDRKQSFFSLKTKNYKNKYLKYAEECIKCLNDDDHI